MILESLEEIVAVIDDTDAVGGRVLVGIVGEPGAGKSTIAALLVDELPDAVLLPMDGFHLPQAELVKRGSRERMGAPDTFDVEGFLNVLRAVRDGVMVRAPGFDRDIEEAVPDQIEISADARVVVIEGNYLLLDDGTGVEGDGTWSDAAELFDVTFFVEVDRDIRLGRLIERHIRFGKTPDAAAAWALGPDEANARLIAETAERADHVIKLP